MAGAVRAAPSFGLPERCRVRLVDDRAELYVEASGPPWADPADRAGRARAVASGAALRNLELAVSNLGHRPLVLLLPDRRDPLHLATVRAGESVEPDEGERRLHRAMRRSLDHARPFSTRPVPAPLWQRLHSAWLPPGVQALPMADGRLRSIGTVLAAAARHRLDRDRDPSLADVDGSLGPCLHAIANGGPNGIAGGVPNGIAGSIAGGAALAQRLSTGRLLLITTASDRPADWLRAGWAVQNLWLTAVSGGLAASVVGGVLDAPGVRAALASRLGQGAGDYPQLLLRIGWPADPVAVPAAPLR